MYRYIPVCVRVFWFMRHGTWKGHFVVKCSPFRKRWFTGSFSASDYSTCATTSLQARGSRWVIATCNYRFLCLHTNWHRHVLAATVLRESKRTESVCLMQFVDRKAKSHRTLIWSLPFCPLSCPCSPIKCNTPSTSSDFAKCYKYLTVASAKRGPKGPNYLQQVCAAWVSKLQS